ncbi:hypothetical protein MMC30_007103 [Trapelia coarctata]|nr:hypothetical protein [Trapelia coarctata]
MPSPPNERIKQGHLAYADHFKDDVIAASASGDLPKIRLLFKEWPLTPPPATLGGGPGASTNTQWMYDAFSAAIENHRLEVVAYLMENGFQLDAVLAGVAARTKSIPVFQTLLDHSWNINDAGRGSPSLGHGFPKEVLPKLFLYDKPLREWFLTHGADPNIPSSQGFNCLDYAAGCTDPGVDPIAVLKTLVQHGGQPARSSALPIAASRPCRPTSECIEIMAYLLDHGAFINARQMEWRPEFHATCEARMMKGTALHVAVRRMDEEMVDFLLQRGADPMVEDWSGCTAMTVKAWRGDPNEQKWETIQEKLFTAVKASGSAQNSGL